MWKILYIKSVEKDLKKLSTEIRQIIQRSIEEKLMTDPLKFGVLLRRNLKGLMKLRVGNYRIIYKIEKAVVTVFVIKIGHRKEVYD